MTTTTFNLSVLPSKKDILFHLFNNGHITFDELWLLAQDTIVTNYINQPTPICQPPLLHYQPLLSYVQSDTNQKDFSPEDTL